VASNDDAQLQGVRPIQLHGPARHPILREEHFLVRPVLQTPLGHPPLQRAQMPLRYIPRFSPGKMLQQRLGFQLGRLLQHGLHLRPDGRQRIGPRAPRVLALQLLRRLLGLQILARGRTANVRVHRAQRDVSSALIFFHESVVLLFCYHGLFGSCPETTQLQDANRCPMLPQPPASSNCRHWKILIVVCQPYDALKKPQA